MLSCSLFFSLSFCVLVLHVLLAFILMTSSFSLVPPCMQTVGGICRELCRKLRLENEEDVAEFALSSIIISIENRKHY